MQKPQETSTLSCQRLEKRIMRKVKDPATRQRRKVD